MANKVLDKAKAALNRKPENQLVKKYGRMIPVEEMKAQKAAARAEEEARARAAEEEAVKENAPVVKTEESKAKAPEEEKTAEKAALPGPAQDKAPVDDYTRDLLPELESLLAAEIIDMMTETPAEEASEVPALAKEEPAEPASAEEEPAEPTPVEETPGTVDREEDLQIIDLTETPMVEAELLPANEIPDEEELTEAMEKIPEAEGPVKELVPIQKTTAEQEAKKEDAAEAEQADVVETEKQQTAEAEKTDIAEIEKQKTAEAVETETHAAGKKQIDIKKYAAWTMAAAGILLVGYLGTASFYRTHYYPNTMLNGINVSHKDSHAVQTLLEDNLAGYELEVVGRNGITDHLSAEQLGLTLLEDQSIQEQIMQQNGLAWPVKLFQKTDLQTPTVAQCKNAVLRKSMATMSLVSDSNQIPPENAQISQYTSSEGYIVLREKEGATIKRAALREAIEEAAARMEDQLELDTLDVYEKPMLLSDDKRLNAAVEKLNSYAQAEIILQVGDEQNIVDGKVISDWLTVDEDYQVTFHEEGVTEYVNRLARKYDTAWDDEKLVRSWDGQEITVGNCHYGWLVDKKKEREQLLQEVQEGAQITRELNYEMTANSHGPHDYGDSYVEIDLTHQTLWLYYQGKLIIETPFVSGNPSKGNETHTGVFGLMYKERDATLTGQGYSSPVKYWMPFNGNEGMHDASWRDKFGGTLYAYAGSHGCVNLPTAAAATIYDYMEKNYPIIVHK